MNGQAKDVYETMIRRGLIKKVDGTDDDPIVTLTIKGSLVGAWLRFIEFIKNIL